jgi:hypothetical protein
MMASARSKNPRRSRLAPLLAALQPVEGVVLGDIPPKDALKIFRDAVPCERCMLPAPQYGQIPPAHRQRMIKRPDRRTGDQVPAGAGFGNRRPPGLPGAARSAALPANSSSPSADEMRELGPAILPAPHQGLRACSQVSYLRPLLAPDRYKLAQLEHIDLLLRSA